MQLRILRKHSWWNASKYYGGRPEWSLQSKDVLQFLDQEGQWVDVPVVEEEIPLNPEQQQLENTMKEMEDWLPPYVKEDWLKK